MADAQIIANIHKFELGLGRASDIVTGPIHFAAATDHGREIW